MERPASEQVIETQIACLMFVLPSAMYHYGRFKIQRETLGLEGGVSSQRGEGRNGRAARAGSVAPELPRGTRHQPESVRILWGKTLKKRANEGKIALNLGREKNELEPAQFKFLGGKLTLCRLNPNFQKKCGNQPVQSECLEIFALSDSI